MALQRLLIIGRSPFSGHGHVTGRVFQTAKSQNQTARAAEGFEGSLTSVRRLWWHSRYRRRAHGVGIECPERLRNSHVSRQVRNNPRTFHKEIISQQSQTPPPPPGFVPPAQAEEGICFLQSRAFVNASLFGVKWNWGRMDSCDVSLAGRWSTWSGSRLAAGH